MGKNTGSTSPYLNARQEWNERYGSYIAAARGWRVVAVFSLLIAAAAVGGVVWFASQNQLIPYVVEVDGRGSTLGVYAARRGTNPDTERNMIRYQLAQFVKDVRGVSPDTAVQRTAITRAYAHLSSAYPAYNAVNAWFTTNVPFERAAKETVSIEVKQILPLSEKTWRVEWIESARPRNAGDAPPAVEMTGTLGVITGGTVSEKNMLLNPIGLYVSDFDWSRQLGTGK